MHSVVNLPCEVLSRAKTISRHSSGCVSLTRSRKRDWKWTGSSRRWRRGRGPPMRGLAGLEGGVVVAEDLGELVADEGAVEALGGVELVAVLHGLGDAA
jgi:hypothetical protein